eukprot:667995_1
MSAGPSPSNKSLSRQGSAQSAGGSPRLTHVQSKATAVSKVANKFLQRVHGRGISKGLKDSVLYDGEAKHKLNVIKAAFAIIRGVGNVKDYNLKRYFLLDRINASSVDTSLNPTFSLKKKEIAHKLGCIFYFQTLVDWEKFKSVVDEFPTNSAEFQDLFKEHVSGVIPLQDAVVEKIDPPTDGKYEFKITTPERTYNIICPTERERLEWILHIRSVIDIDAEEKKRRDEDALWASLTDEERARILEERRLREEELERKRREREAQLQRDEELLRLEAAAQKLAAALFSSLKAAFPKIHARDFQDEKKHWDCDLVNSEYEKRAKELWSTLHRLNPDLKPEDFKEKGVFSIRKLVDALDVETNKLWEQISWTNPDLKKNNFIDENGRLDVSKLLEILETEGAKLWQNLSKLNSGLNESDFKSNGRWDLCKLRHGLLKEGQVLFDKLLETDSKAGYKAEDFRSKLDTFSKALASLSSSDADGKLFAQAAKVVAHLRDSHPNAARTYAQIAADTNVDLDASPAVVKILKCSPFLVIDSDAKTATHTGEGMAWDIPKIVEAIDSFGDRLFNLLSKLDPNLDASKFRLPNGTWDIEKLCAHMFGNLKSIVYKLDSNRRAGVLSGLLCSSSSKKLADNDDLVHKIIDVLPKSEKDQLNEIVDNEWGQNLLLVLRVSNDEILNSILAKLGSDDQQTLTAFIDFSETLRKLIQEINPKYLECAESKYKHDGKWDAEALTKALKKRVVTLTSVEKEVIHQLDKRGQRNKDASSRAKEAEETAEKKRQERLEQMQREEKTVKAFRAVAENGVTCYKHSFKQRGAPGKRRIHIEFGKGANHKDDIIVWTAVGKMLKGKTRKMRIAEAHKVQFGKRTRALRAGKSVSSAPPTSENTFSVVSKKRTLDLQVRDVETRDVWANGIQALINSYKRSIDDTQDMASGIPNFSGVIPIGNFRRPSYMFEDHHKFEEFKDEDHFNNLSALTPEPSVSSKTASHRAGAASETEEKREPSEAKSAEPLKSESPKVDSPKVESPKVDSPKVDSPKVESPKADSPKVESPKADSPKVESPKVESPKVESPKADSPKAEISEAKSPESKSPEVEPIKSESPKVEPIKSESPKAESPKAESPKADSLKVEAAKAESPKVEAAKAESPKVEAAKADSEKEKASSTEESTEESGSGSYETVSGSYETGSGSSEIESGSSDEESDLKSAGKTDESKTDETAA